MSQRPLRLSLHLVSSRAMRSLVGREDHFDCVRDHNEHHRDESLDQLDDPSQWEGEFPVFNPAVAVAENTMGFALRFDWGGHSDFAGSV